MNHKKSIPVSSETRDGKEESPLNNSFTRRLFLHSVGLGAAALGLQQIGCSVAKPAVQATTSTVPEVIPGFEKTIEDPNISKDWKPFSDRKVRVGLVGYGLCKFASAFGFQDHPNVEVVAVSDLFPDRCAELAKVTGCSKTYPSLEDLVKDDNVEAVFVATDAPSHAKHAIEVLKHGKHVASAVPAVFGSLEDADNLFEAVKNSGKKYMMFETSVFHGDVYAMRQLYRSGELGRVVYSEGEYYHYMGDPLPGYKNWRDGLPPQWYPTHSNGYYIGVTGGSFTEVSCMGLPSTVTHLQAANNRYKNPFGTEVAMFRTSEGGMSRMAVSWDTPGFGAEAGRVRAEKGSYNLKYQGLQKSPPEFKKPPLPPGVAAGGHGGSHGYLTDEFIRAIIMDRQPLVNIAMALNLTVSGIIAHQSALKDGELLKIPQYKL